MLSDSPPKEKQRIWKEAAAERAKLSRFQIGILRELSGIFGGTLEGFGSLFTFADATKLFRECHNLFGEWCPPAEPRLLLGSPGYGYADAIICPRCGSTYTHIENVTDGDVLMLALHCEGGHRFKVEIEHRKGHTHIRSEVTGTWTELDDEGVPINGK